MHIEKETTYCYVISYSKSRGFTSSELSNTDISIFEIEEWNKYLNLSKKFEKIVVRLNPLSVSDEEYEKIPSNIRHSCFYFYYQCPYTPYKGLSKLEFHYGNDQDIYERVFIETINKDRHDITINELATWLHSHEDEINSHYRTISSYDFI